MRSGEGFVFLFLPTFLFLLNRKPRLNSNAGYIQEIYIEYYSPEYLSATVNVNHAEVRRAIARNVLRNVQCYCFVVDTIPIVISSLFWHNH